MQKKLYVMIAAFMLMISSAVAQVTTSSVSGKVTSGSEDIIGATIKVVHEPSGTVYRAVTNQDGRYSIQGMRPGGPYNVEISYVGYNTKSIKNVTLSLGQNTIIDGQLKEGSELLDEVIVSGSRRSNMRTDRASVRLHDEPE